MREKAAEEAAAKKATEEAAAKKAAEEAATAEGATADGVTAENDEEKDSTIVLSDEEIEQFVTVKEQFVTVRRRKKKKIRYWCVQCSREEEPAKSNDGRHWCRCGARLFDPDDPAHQIMFKGPRGCQ